MSYLYIPSLFLVPKDHLRTLGVETSGRLLTKAECVEKGRILGLPADRTADVVLTVQGPMLGSYMGSYTVNHYGSSEYSEVSVAQIQGRSFLGTCGNLLYR